MLIHRDQRGGTSLISAAQRIVLLPEFGAPYILQADDGRAVVAGAQDDVLEFRRLRQAALGGHCERLLHGLAGRRLPDTADGELLVLVGDRCLYVSGGNAQLRHAIGFEPDPHGVVRRAENARLVRPRNTLDCIQNVEVRVVGDVGAVIAFAGGIHGKHHHERGRFFCT